MTVELPVSAPPPPPPKPAPPHGARVWWRFLLKHHEALGVLIAFLGLLGTIVFSGAAIFVSLRVADITERQKRIQEIQAAPQISVQCRPNESGASVDLVVENSGAPLNHLQVESWTFVPMLIVGSSRDTLFAFAPAVPYFMPISKTFRVQGTVARAEPETYGDGVLASRNNVGQWYSDSSVAVAPLPAHHLVHLSYDDALDRRYDRFIVVNEHDFWDVHSEATAKELRDTLEARMLPNRLCHLNLAESQATMFLSRMPKIVPMVRGDGRIPSEAQVKRSPRL